MIIETPRLRWRNWRDEDRAAFAALHADPEVMADYGGPLDASASDVKLARYRTAFDGHGYTRWAVEDRDGTFLGYVGLMPSPPAHPLGPHADIGWRLNRFAWGQGIATEAAIAALQDGFTRCGLSEILAHTTVENLRSQAVMARLGMRRDPSRDFEEPDGTRLWRLLVWAATP